jgi:hypothetical protein
VVWDDGTEEPLRPALCAGHLPLAGEATTFTTQANGVPSGGVAAAGWLVGGGGTTGWSGTVARMRA